MDKILSIQTNSKNIIGIYCIFNKLLISCNKKSDIKFLKDGSALIKSSDEDKCVLIDIDSTYDVYRSTVIVDKLSNKDFYLFIILF